MEIKCIPLGACDANCYMLSTEGAAVVIDPGAYHPVVAEFLRSNSQKPRMILITHSHFDHIEGAARLREETDTPIAVGERDAYALSDSVANLSKMFGCDTVSFSADSTLKDGEEFAVGDIYFKAIESPGHTVGSMCYLTEKTLFSGDVLFAGSVGRTDFPNGSFAVLQQSLKRLLLLDGDTVVLSGHGPATDIETERRFNPYIRG